MSFLLGLIPVVGSAIGAGTLIGTVVDAVAIAGLSAVSSSLFNKKPTSSPGGGMETSLSVEPDRPQSLILGRAVTGGSLDYAANWGGYGRNPRISNVIVGRAIRLADHPIHALETVWVNGAVATYRGTTANGDTALVPSGQRTIRVYDGRQTSADDVLVGGAAENSTNNPWDANAIGRSTAYVRTWELYDKANNNRLSAFMWGVQGARLYDARLDSSVGGSGPHRRDNPDTWQYTANPIIEAHNVMLGIRVRDAAGNLQHFYGLEDADIDTWPLANLFAAANECDRVVHRADGSAVTNYSAGGEFFSDVAPYDTIDALLGCCGARLADLGGRFKAILPSMLATPRVIITDDQVLASRECTFDVLSDDNQRANTVAAKYRSWITGELTDAPLYENTTYIAADGGRRMRELTFTQYVWELDQVQRLQKQAALESRRQRKFEMYLGRWALDLEAGDCLAWISAENGFDAKLFVIEATDELPNFDTQLIIRETDPDDIDWHPATDYRPPSDGVFVPLTAIVRDVLDFHVEPFVLKGAEGTQHPAILALWDNPDDAEIAFFEIRLASDPTSVIRDQADISSAGVAASVVIARDLQRATAYQVRMRLTGSGIGDGAWTLWRDVFTPGVGYINLADLGAELLHDIEDARAVAAGVAAVTLAQISAESELAKEMRARAAEDGAAALERAVDLVGRLTDQATTREAMVRQSHALTTRIDEVTGDIVGTLTDTIAAAQATALAAVDAESRVRAGETGALGARVDTVTAQLEGRASAQAVQDLTAEVSSIEGTVTSHTSAITAITSALPTLASASGLQSLDTRVTYAEQSIEAVGRALTQIDVALDGKASVTALTSLSATVASHGDTISAQGQAIAGLQAQVSDRVTASAFQTFQVSIEGTVSAQATALTQVQARADNATAGGYLLFRSVAGAGGAHSRAQLEVYSEAAGSWRRAGFFADAGSSSDYAYFGVEADRFVVLSSDGTTTALFDQTGKIPGAWITRITTDQITAGTALLDAAFIRDATITNAKIRNLEVDTLKLAYNSVNEINYVSGPASAGSQVTVLRTLVVRNPDYYPCLIAFSGAGSCAVDSNASGNPAIYLRVDGQQRLDYQHPRNGPGAVFPYPSQIGFGGMCILPPRGPSFTLEVVSNVYFKSISLSECTIYVTRIKR